MAFDPQEHLIKVKGGQLYLEVRWRLIWFRELHPDASIEVELTHLDLDSKLAIARATVTLPNGTKATEIGSETEKDFPAGWVEKAATKAVGRALAALGFGTQFALELDEGERLADSPSAARNGGGAGATAPAVGAQAVAKPAATGARAATPTVTASVPQRPPASSTEGRTSNAAEHEGGLPRSAADWTGDQLRQQIEESAGKALKTGPDWKALAREHGVPEPTSAAELGSRTWLLGMYQALRCAEYQEMIASVQATDPGAEERVTQMVAEALSERDRRRIGMAHYDAIRARGEARKAELSAPLLSGGGGQGRAQVAS